MPTQYDYSLDRGSEKEWKCTTNEWRSHFYATSTTTLPLDRVWAEMLSTQDYSKWGGPRIGALPSRFGCGAKVDGATIGECREKFTIHVYCGEELFVLEAKEGFRGTNIRVCVDTFFKTGRSRLFASSKKQQARVDALAAAFSKWCDTRTA